MNKILPEFDEIAVSVETERLSPWVFCVANIDDSVIFGES